MSDEVPGSSTASVARRCYALYVLAILFLLYVLAAIDRQILAVMVDPIRARFDLIDSQVSLLSGLAFALVYAVAGFPAAWLADRHRRTTIIAGGLALWSLFTGLFALARSWWQLVLCRMGVGLGEACLNPAALPLLADYFAGRNLGKAVATYMLAVPVGNGLASMLGGAMLAAPERGIAPGALSALAPWQLLLLLLAATGCVLLLLFFTVREPVRRQGTATPRPAAGPALAELAHFLRRHALVFGAIALPLLASALMYFGVGYWIPSYFIRSAEAGGENAGELVFYWGLIGTVVGACGVLTGGALADHLCARHDDGMWRTLGIGTVLLGLGFTLFSFVDAPRLALLVLVPGVFGNGILQAAGITTVLLVTPNHLRGQVSALYFLLVNLVGAGLGPTLVAVLSDFVFTGAGGLGLAMALVACASSVAALLMLVKTAEEFCALRRQVG